MGIAAAIGGRITTPESADPNGRAVDVLGQLLGASSLAALVLAGIELGNDPLTSAASFVVAVVGITLFIVVEARKTTSALVPLDLFRSRPFVGALAGAASMTFGMYGVLFLVPLHWQSTGRLTSIEAGLALLPMALLFVATSPVSGAFSERVGQRPLTVTGLIVMSAGLITLSATASSPSLLPAEAGLALTGIGMGLATAPMTAAAVGAVALERAGTASALVNVARMTGASLGVALLGAIFALRGNGGPGLERALIVGALIQASGAATAWVMMAGPSTGRTA